MKEKFKLILRMLFKDYPSEMFFPSISMKGIFRNHLRQLIDESIDIINKGLFTGRQTSLPCNNKIILMENIESS